MHKLYPVNKRTFSLCLCKIYAIKKFVSFLQSFIYLFFFVISCVTKINRIPFILHKIYYAKGQER